MSHVDEIIARLNLAPHPEGGHFREVFRDQSVNGRALELSQSVQASGPTAHILGNDIISGEHPQIVVPANIWQSARSLGEWSLVGCTVAPGFEFSAFEMAPKGWTPCAPDS